MKLRLTLIGGINAFIAVGLIASRGYEALFAGYLAVSLVVAGIGILWKQPNPSRQA